MKDFDSLLVISVKRYIRLTRPALHDWKCLTVENIKKLEIKCNQLHYFKKVNSYITYFK